MGPALQPCIFVGQGPRALPVGKAGDREGRPYAKIYIGSSHTKVSLDSRGKK